MFDFRRFLAAEGVEFVTEGPNVARGNINIACPFCGARDPSHHLGIRVDGGAYQPWGCWRDPTHRGKRPERLVKAIKQCSWQAAKEICGTEVPVDAAPMAELLQRAQALFSEYAELRPLEPVDLPEEFVECRRAGKRWLEHRGFDAKVVMKEFGVKYCYIGRWRSRVIFPVFFDGDLVGWTARAVGKAQLKYISHPEGDTVKRVVYNYDAALAGGKMLMVVEGPVDCMKADLLGRFNGWRAVATFGVAYKPSQVSCIVKLAERFDRVAVLYDKGAGAQARRLAEDLSVVRAGVLKLPGKVADPGELDANSMAVLLCS